MKPQRPSEAVFADGKTKRALAIHPDAIGVSYAVRKTEQVATIKDGVAVLSIDGPLEHKSGDTWWSYWQTYEDLARDFKSCIEDENVNAIVLKFDSPGGEVSGLNETVAILKSMKKKSGKSVVAYVDEACYSAAYALAMVADKIYLPQSGGVGSIGVITTMADCVEADKKAGFNVHVIASGSKKTDNHPHFPLTDSALKRTRKQIDKLASTFFELVSDSRGLTTETIAGYQAGVFGGKDAVKAGLADAVMSLEECLTSVAQQFSSSRQPTDRSVEKESAPMNLAAKALNEANAAMAAAKTDADRALCAARIVAAEANLAKVKKTKTKDTTTHTEEVDDGEADEESESEDSSSSGSDDDSSSSDDDSSDDDESESASADAVEDEEKNGAKGDNAKSGLYTKDRLLRLARQIVGSATSRSSANKHGTRVFSIEEVMGALHAMGQSHKGHGKLAAEVQTLKADAERTKVRALVESGLKSGRLAPSQKEWARTQSPAGLKAYLDASPKHVHTTSEEHTESRIAGVGRGGVSAEMAKIWLKQGFTEADFPKLVEKLNSANKTNGAS